MEELMYYVWQLNLPATLQAPDRTPIEVIDPGERNRDAGPDFFNAKVRIGGTVWAGNVEMHVRATDWQRHRHEGDPAYNSVILHVVLQADADIRLAQTGEPITTAVMHIPQRILTRYHELTSPPPPAPGGAPARLSPLSPIRCGARLAEVPRPLADAWLAALAVGRMMQKVQRVRDLVEGRRESWQEALYVMLCRSLGTGLNSDACERLARSLPYQALQKHADTPLQVEAMLLGQAGWLDRQAESGTVVMPCPCPEAGGVADAAQPDYRQLLRREYDFLRAKFCLTPLPASAWRMGRLRPQASPQRRMACLAALLTSQRDLFGQVVDATDVGQLIRVLSVKPSPFWLTHYYLGQPTAEPSRAAGLGLQTVRSLIINAVVPILLAYGQWNSDQARMDRALAMLSQIPPEVNRYMDEWQTVGLTPRNALETQALLRLYRDYCQPHRCLHCRFGRWLIKS